MKKVFCFTIVLCIALGSLTAQQNHIIAGDTSGAIYYDIEPDIELWGYDYPNSYQIDLDQNGTMDFTIEADAYSGMKEHYESVSVNSVGSNRVGYSSYISSMNMYKGRGVYSGYTINEDILFTTARVYLKRWRNDYWGSYYYSWVPGDYIPVSLTIGPSNCIYFGWIKVYGVSNSTITLDSYAVYIPEYQYCLPEGITFETQAQIDSFQINYPCCNVIEGDVEIFGENIYNLNGLEDLVSVGGNVHIQGNPNLTSLTGLENIEYIGGDLWIKSNAGLSNLSGLEGITEILGDIIIYYNYSLINLAGLENLITLGGNLEIESNSISSLSGLDGLTSISGDVWIEGSELTSLQGLQNVSTIGNNLTLVNCHTLVNLSGLSGLELLMGEFYIKRCIMLTDFSGLSSLHTIEDGLIIEELNGITNLEGLNALETIGGLGIWECQSLQDLEGMKSGVEIKHGIAISDNDALESLEALHAYNLWGENILIAWNDELSSLSGLDNIDAGTVEYLYIGGNSKLSECHVRSVCEYLENPNGEVDINDNANGCNTPEEVQDSCDANSGLYDYHDIEKYMMIFPNPASENLSVSVEGFIIDEVILYTLTGQQVLAISPKSETIDILHLNPGMYIVEVTIMNTRIRQKLLVE